MRSKTNFQIAILVFVAAACSQADPVVVAESSASTSATTETTEAGSPTTEPSTTAGEPEATTSSSASTDSSSASSTESVVEPATDPFRIAPAGELPGSVILYGPDGLFRTTHSEQLSKAIDGSVSSAVDTFETGIVYQRPGDDRRVFVQSAGADQELLVAADNQTIRLVGVRIEPADDSFHVLYVRRTFSTPEESQETLRSYNMTTGEVSEILETGGWESGTNFSYIGDELAVGRWSGEAFTGTHVVNVITGEIEQRFPEDILCFDGEPAEGCLPFTVAALSGDKMYGFGTSPHDAVVVDEMALYELDTSTSELTELISFPWDNGLYYPVDMWVQGSSVVVGLSTSTQANDGQPLPALIYDITTGEATTAPVAGYVRPGFLS